MCVVSLLRLHTHVVLRYSYLAMGLDHIERFRPSLSEQDAAAIGAEAAANVAALSVDSDGGGSAAEASDGADPRK